LDDRKEEPFLGGLAKDMGKFFQARFLVEADGNVRQKNPAEALTGNKGGHLIGRSLFGERNAKKEPGFLVRESFQEILLDGVGSPRADRLGAVRTRQLRQAGEEEFEVVGDLGDGADGAAGGTDRVGLAEGDGRGDAVDPVDAGAIHPLEELAGVGAEGFGVAALAFGIEGIESEGGFARTGRAGEDVEHPQGEIEGKILEVVLPGSLDADGA